MLGTGAFNGSMFGTGAFKSTTFETGAFRNAMFRTGAFKGTTFGSGAFKGTNLPKTGFAQQEEEIKVNLTIKDFVLQCPIDFILNLEMSFFSDS